MKWYNIVVLVVVCMLLPPVAAASGSAAAADGNEYVVIWGAFSPAGRESVHSHGIAIDSAGNVYVEEPAMGRFRTYAFGDLPSAGEITFTGDFRTEQNEQYDISLSNGNEWTVGPDVDDDFALIQDAIDAASDGDTILISPGTYQEDVIVNKRLTLDGGYDAVIYGSISLKADGITLTGCMLVSGLRVESENNTLNGVVAGWYPTEGVDGFIVTGSHNTFTNCLVAGMLLGAGATGMIMEDCGGNTFIQCGFIDSYIGADIKNITYTTFSKCGITGRADGLRLSGSGNTFTDCQIANTDYSNTGLSAGGNNTFTNCDIFGIEYGVFGGGTFKECSIAGGECAVSGNGTFTDCIITGNECGMSVGDNTIVANCTISGSECGVFLDGTQGCIFTDCVISGGECGVYQSCLCGINFFIRCTVHGDNTDWGGFVFFADAGLEAAVRDTLGIPEGNISAEDMRTLSVLSAPNRGIVSLSGLQYAANLQDLDLNHNNVSDICPVSCLTGLHTLVLSHNNVHDLTPLVINSNAGGLGPGDLADLRYNGLDLTPGSAAMTAIMELMTEGVEVMYEPQETAPVLSANFTMDVTEGLAPLTVTFTDCSTGSPEEWFWEFGDGTTSTVRNPVHTYVDAGTCTVCLTVTNEGDSDTFEQVDCICVHAPSTQVDEFPAGWVVMMMVCGILGGVGIVLRRNSGNDVDPDEIQ